MSSATISPVYPGAQAQAGYRWTQVILGIVCMVAAANIQYPICLDAVRAGNPAHLRLAARRDPSRVSEVYSLFSATAEATGTWITVLYTVSLMDILVALCALLLLKPVLRRHLAKG